jgi:molybdopterin/thiamine biosynthesis adenylyltransferase
VVVGAGGNIGSHLVFLLARLGRVGRLVLVDPDRYDRTNLATQAAGPGDVGRFKVLALKARLRAQRPDLDVVALPRRLEDLPLGRLRGAAILACLDSRAARREVNRAAWRLGQPWIDAGVQGEGLLARVTVHVPAPGAPCLECGWSDEDYAALDTAYPCRPPRAAATGAPAALGALAASLQALECRKLLDGDPALAAGRRVLLDARHHGCTSTRVPRTPSCLFDHETWRIEPRPLFGLARGLPAAATVEIEGRRFLRRLVCPSCGTARETFRLERLVPRALRACPRCGTAMEAPGFFQEARASLSSRPLGLLRGDVVTVRTGEEALHVELA